MNTTFMLLGVVCLIAAIVGGGLKAAGVEMPAVGSVRRQLLLGLLGVVLIVAGPYIGSGSGSGGHGGNEIMPVPPIDNTQNVGNASTDSKDRAANQQNGNDKAANKLATHAPASTVGTKPSANGVITRLVLSLEAPG